MPEQRPPWDRPEREGPVTTYRIHRRHGVVETHCAETAAAWSGVGAKVTAVTEGRR